MLELVGLTEVAGKRSKGFSLGMGQRLGIAAALLGDPAILMFDEPVNGLDPEGILWIRNLMKALAAEGRTIFVSSHLMSEMENTADHLLVIGRGRLIADCSVAEFIERNSVQSVRIRTPKPEVLANLIAVAGGTATPGRGGALVAHGLPVDQIGDLAFENGIRLHELAPAQASLEEAFMELTADSVEFQARTPGPAAPPGRGRRCTDGGGLTWQTTQIAAGRPAAPAAAGDRPGRLRGRAAVGVHQDPVDPLHLLDAARPDRGHASGSARWPAPGPRRTHGAIGPGFDATQQSLGGLYVGQLVIAVLGALTITSEYSTGMIRTSLAVQPRRGVVFAAKAVVFAAVTLVTGLVASFGSFFVGQAMHVQPSPVGHARRPERAARRDRRRPVPDRMRHARLRPRGRCCGTPPVPSPPPSGCCSC